MLLILIYSLEIMEIFGRVHVLLRVVKSVGWCIGMRGMRIFFFCSSFLWNIVTQYGPALLIYIWNVHGKT